MLSVLLESEILIPRPSRVLKSVVAGTLNSLAGSSNPLSWDFFSNVLEQNSSDPFSGETVWLFGSVLDGYSFDFGCSNWIFLLRSVLWLASVSVKIVFNYYLQIKQVLFKEGALNCNED